MHFSVFCDKLMVSGGFYMSENIIIKALENAEASVNMEGLSVAEYSKELCKKLLMNEITMDEYIKFSVMRVKGDVV